jgi:DNA-binding PadR family transcriptional regulator
VRGEVLGVPSQALRSPVLSRRRQRALYVAWSQHRNWTRTQEVTRYGITKKGMAYLERWRREQAQIAEAAARETAPLRRDNRPFSMMKR